MSTASQYLTLALGPEIFGIDIRQVREILDMRRTAALPQAPAFLLGMTDVRGEGIPVVDLRLKLGLPAVPAGPTTRIVILDVSIEGHCVPIGFVADRVLAVSTLDGAGLDPAPAVGGCWQAHGFAGIGRKEADFVIVLAIDRLMAHHGPAIAPAAPLAA